MKKYDILSTEEIIFYLKEKNLFVECILETMEVYVKLKELKIKLNASEIPKKGSDILILDPHFLSKEIYEPSAQE